MALGNPAPTPPIQPPSRGAPNVIYLAGSEKNPLLTVASVATSVANTVTFDYVSALQPFLNDDKEITASKEVKMADPTREEIQAQIAAAEARGDTKIARLEGKLDLVLVKLDDVREDGRHTRNNAILIGVSLAILIIGVVAAAPVLFDLGSRFRETITKEVQERIPATPTPKNLK